MRFHPIETNPCSPSPCNYNGECKVRNGVAVCIYPECVINSDCPRDKACFSQKCKDPCIGACGINSLCQTVNHKPICSCPVGFTGNARVQCTIPTLEGKLFNSVPTNYINKTHTTFCRPHFVCWVQDAIFIRLIFLKSFRNK